MYIYLNTPMNDVKCLVLPGIKFVKTNSYLNPLYLA